MVEHGYTLRGSSTTPERKGEDVCVSVHVRCAQAHKESLKASKSQRISFMEQQGSPSGPFGFSSLKLLLQQIILAVSEASLNLVLYVSILFGFSEVNPGCHLSAVNGVLLRDLQLGIMGLKSLPAFFTLLSESFCRACRSHQALCKGVPENEFCSPK